MPIKASVSARPDNPVFIVSDHGFKAFHKQIRLSIALASAGLGRDAYVVPEGGSAMIYVDRKHTAELVPKVRQALQGIEGIERIAAREDFPSLGLPDPQKDPQMAEPGSLAKSDYTFSRPRRTEARSWLPLHNRAEVTVIWRVIPTWTRSS